MIDAHAHLAYSFEEEEIKNVLASFKDAGGSIVIDTATNSSEHPMISKLLNTYKEVYAVIGLHPEESARVNINNELEKLNNFIKKNDKIVGIGETGVDYLYAENNDVIETQKKLFISHIEIAKNNKLPLIIHARGKTFEDYSPYYDVLELLERENFPNRVYFHSFGGDIELAKIIESKNYVIGINGISTYSSAKILAEIIKEMPLKMILLETDTPYLIPSNMDRNLLGDKKKNEPLGILYTAKRIAKLRDISLEEVLEETEKNTRAFFERML